MPRYPNETKQRQFRLKQETLDDLDFVARCLTKDTGIEHNRTDAIRWLAHEGAKNFRKKFPESD